MRRFIAGATCPACGAMDALFVDVSVDADVVHCTECKYESRRGETDRRDTTPEGVKGGGSEGIIKLVDTTSKIP